MRASDLPRRARTWTPGLAPGAVRHAQTPTNERLHATVSEPVDIVAIEKRVAIARWRRDRPSPARLPG
jgi:hypothetical protein